MRTFVAMRDFFLYTDTLRLDKIKRAISSMVEQRTLNPEVEGSSPSWPTNRLSKGLAYEVQGAKRFL